MTLLSVGRVVPGIVDNIVDGVYPSKRVKEEEVLF